MTIVPRHGPLACFEVLVAYCWYRKIELDLYVLAIGVLSVVAVANIALSRVLFDTFMVDGVFGFILMSLSVISVSAFGAFWLKRVVAEDRP